jgi:hypothetical protein
MRPWKESARLFATEKISVFNRVEFTCWTLIRPGSADRHPGRLVADPAGAITPSASVELINTATQTPSNLGEWEDVGRQVAYKLDGTTHL